MKSKLIAFLLWCLCLLGICGLQRMYVGQWLWGLAYFCTFGFLGLGQLGDLGKLGRMVDRYNRETRILERRFGPAGRIVAAAPVPRAVRGRPEPMGPAVREVVREVIVKIRCQYCRHAYVETLDRCPNCGAAA